MFANFGFYFACAIAHCIAQIFQYGDQKSSINTIFIHVLYSKANIFPVFYSIFRSSEWQKDQEKLPWNSKLLKWLKMHNPKLSENIFSALNVVFPIFFICLLESNRNGKSIWVAFVNNSNSLWIVETILIGCVFGCGWN